MPCADGFSLTYYDGRNTDPLSRYENPVGYRLMRLGPALQFLDPTGVALPIPAQAQDFAVACDASGVSIASNEPASAASGMFQSILFRRVDDTGALRVGPLTVDSVTTGNVFGEDLPLTGIRIDLDGTHAVRAWLEAAPGGSTSARMAAIAADGAVSGPWTITTGYVSKLALAMSGGDALALRETYRGCGSTPDTSRLWALVNPVRAGAPYAVDLG